MESSKIQNHGFYNLFKKWINDQKIDAKPDLGLNDGNEKTRDDTNDEHDEQGFLCEFSLPSFD